ncbi:MAG: cytoplasmic protein [Desulfobacteraceae bacterium]|nr:cytoplasmic protein [Desulfobacteraceae bacterium]MCF8095703.1 cytoplasmic protein [Desulfobacteraceae bacterium]
MIGKEAAAEIENGGFAAILARAGVGKTALMVQLAIYGMLNNKNILHISTENPVDKVNLWYREVFDRLVQEEENSQKDRLWEQLLHRRFIMTFETETFSLDKLEKRVSELTASEIFQPSQIMIDGFSIEDQTGERLKKLKDFALANRLILWFTMRTHRDEPVETSGIPKSFSQFAELFDLMLLLHPNKNRVYLKIISETGQQDNERKSELYLDPATMLISDTPV